MQTAGNKDDLSSQPGATDNNVQKQSPANLQDGNNMQKAGKTDDLSSEPGATDNNVQRQLPANLQDSNNMPKCSVIITQEDLAAALTQVSRMKEKEEKTETENELKPETSDKIDKKKQQK